MDFAKKIIKDGALKPAKDTGNIGQGEGIYEPSMQSFIFFNTTHNLFEKRIFDKVLFYFKSDFLINKSFYTAKMHSGNPAGLNKDKKKYPKNTKQYERVLKNLYTQSIKRLPGGKYFFVSQQVAIKNKLSGTNFKKNIVGIQFNNMQPSKTLLNYIKKEYPNVLVDIRFVDLKDI